MLLICFCRQKTHCCICCCYVVVFVFFHQVYNLVRYNHVGMVFGAEEYLQSPDISWKRVQKSDVFKDVFQLGNPSTLQLFWWTWWLEIYGISTFSFRSFRMLQIDWNINVNTSWKMYINVKSFKHVKKGSQRRHQELGWLKDIGRQRNRNKIEAGSHGSTTNAGVSGLDCIGFRFDNSIQKKTLMGMVQVSSWDTWCILKAQWDVIDALLGDGFKHLFFLSYLGKWSNLTSIFFK